MKFTYRLWTMLLCFTGILSGFYALYFQPFLTEQSNNAAAFSGFIAAALSLGLYYIVHLTNGK